MKKSWVFLFALLLVGLTACGGPSGSQNQDNRVVTAYTIDIPDEFEEQEVDGLDLYYAAADGSNVSMVIQEKTDMDDASFQGITADMLRESLEEGFRSAYEMEVEITDVSFTQEPVTDFPAYQYQFSYELADMPLEQLVVSINADRIYTITYTDVTGEWMEEFEQSAQNIQLTTETE